MDEFEDMSPCPFCGSLGVAVVGSFVRCGTCGAAGPYGYTDAEAVQRWNARAGVRLPDREVMERIGQATEPQDS